MMMSDSYLITMARNLNCPEMWLDDCVQEARIRLWQHDGPYSRTVARRAQIDFLRRYGPVSHAGVVRQSFNLDLTMPSAGDFTETAITQIDVDAAIAKLPPRYRDLIAGKLRGETLRDKAEQQARWQAQRQLRALVAN